ncbi:hypothetical protein QBC35DRAFT_183864 [Podospora australis]|uniref:Uncharacterized protein n=1 Tax=Podospora australis TaxID=1536484 RepID=A0AAN6WIK1_9PEZI|nr:hypothetical protein QBC35DRAFT_183864 [Podospora australis]
MKNTRGTIVCHREDDGEVVYDPEQALWQKIAAIHLVSPPLPAPSPDQLVKARRVTFLMHSTSPVPQLDYQHGGALLGFVPSPSFEASILRPILKKRPKDLSDLAPRTEPLDFEGEFRERGWEFVANPATGETLWKVQHNLATRDEYTWYRICWTTEDISPNEQFKSGRAIGDGSRFVESLKQGDCIVLWARAMSSQGYTKVKAASVVIEYEFVAE